VILPGYGQMVALALSPLLTVMQLKNRRLEVQRHSPLFFLSTLLIHRSPPPLSSPVSCLTMAMIQRPMRHLLQTPSLPVDLPKLYLIRQQLVFHQHHHHHRVVISCVLCVAIPSWTGVKPVPCLVVRRRSVFPASTSVCKGELFANFARCAKFRSQIPSCKVSRRGGGFNICVSSRRGQG
jgi:hypothetical protein